MIYQEKGAKKNHHQESHQKKNTIHDKFIIFAKLGRQKSQEGEQNTCVYVCK